MQGQHYVTADPAVVVSTLLGSCVAACLRDPVARLGGMTHFLLPGGRVEDDGIGDQPGAHAMEVLVNALLDAGAQRHRLEAKLFGGAHMMDGLAEVGRQNSAFALGFLEAESIRHLGGSLGGAKARRVQYWPASGRARQMMSAGDDVPNRVVRRTVVDGIGRDCGVVEL